MDCDVLAFDFLRDAFPKVDIRVIKATVLEHGDDIDSALSFLNSIINEEKDDFWDALQQSSSTVDLDHHPEIGVSDVCVAPDLSSSNISSIDQVSIEDIIEEAKRDKELVINLIKEVSNLRAKADQENVAALKAKIDAVTSGATVFKKADEVQSQISQRKQENLLRRGEIYGEKAVLATEARELKSRLVQVKLQKKGAMVTLKEIQDRLQGCYDAAVEERKMAEEDGRIKEEEAQKLLTEQEALLAIVEEESEKLETEAEACLQLKEFLAHHGSIVDSLQGEMSILCEDVESFKRQVEEGMWSSISTASSHSNVNPEGPYSFRKCNRPSRTTSSQDLGSKQSHHRSSASSSQEFTHVSAKSNVSSQEFEKGDQILVESEEDSAWRRKLVEQGTRLYENGGEDAARSHDMGHSNVSSQDIEKEEQIPVRSEEDSEWRRQLVKQETRPYENGEAATRSNGTGRTQSSLSSLGTHDNFSALDWGNDFFRNWVSTNGVDESMQQSYAIPLSNTGFPTGEYSELENHHHHYTTERVGRDNSDAGSVFTAQQADGTSSSSSSMVKINADDYRSE